MHIFISWQLVQKIVLPMLGTGRYHSGDPHFSTGESLTRYRCKDQSVLGIWEVYFSRWRIHGVGNPPGFYILMNDVDKENILQSYTNECECSISSSASTEWSKVLDACQAIRKNRHHLISQTI
ncbi:hypothetical protein Tco_0694806 [Tanacetum coccineum]